jgi:hypothetical protein
VKAVLQFDKPQRVFAFARWSWPLPLDYNGHSPAERVRGWQWQVFLTANSWLRRPTVCSVTGWKRSVVWHSEDYLKPWLPIPVSRAVHMRIHRRFRAPDTWREFLQTNALPGCWAFELTCVRKPVVRRSAEEYIACLKRYSPHPTSIIVPWDQFDAR